MDEFSSLFDHKTSVSDTEYAEELQFQEVLDASLHIYNIRHTPSSSSSSKICCEICYEDKEEKEMFEIQGCSHSFCSDCVSRHVGAKLQENIVFISCPGEGCKSTTDPETLRSIIPPNVAARWEEALSESAILALRKCYCPHCSEILLDENDEGDVVTISRCPFCQEWFCLRCNVPWHFDMSCEEFRLFDEDQKGNEKLRRLAQDKEWMECPNCKIFVEKTDGCIHMTCRCKFEFCYLCGSKWSQEHWNCQEEEEEEE
ncbi:E3 ubiquitin-protein ligase RSL1-like [Primulina huaijiensis]|uniref:E3 ubiquitin-protein ligase RSL1-like n=1 Tax=Primulina huaijiensis TaxID=1492673 RepID=UPI003CC700B5